MNKSKQRLPVFLIGIALATAGWAQTGPSPAPVKMTVLPSRVNVRVVLEGVTLPAGNAIGYAAGTEAVLTVNLGSIAAPTGAPAIPADDPALLRAAKFNTGTDGRTSLALTLQEKVPFRIFSEGTKTVIELIKIQRGGTEYLIATETKAELDRSQRARRGFSVGAPDDRSDRLDLTTRMDGKAIVNVFALASPLRLVIDFFDSILEQASASVPVGSHGVERIKVGQFKDGEPYAITRLVFELREPRMFALNAGSGSMDVVFSDMTAVVPAAAAPSPAKTETKPVTPPTAEKKAEVKPAEVKAPPATATAPPPAKTETKPVTPPTAEKKAEVKPAEVKAPPTAEKKAEVKPTETKPAAANPTEVKAPPATATTPPAAEKKIEVKLPEKKVETTPPTTVVPPPDNAAKDDLKDLPPVQEEKPAARTIHDPASKYSGEMISPKFKDADLRDVVLWLAERVSLNVTFDPEVRGRVTGTFVDVPWDQYLDIILKNNKLGRVLEGNVLRIAPLNVLAEEEKAQQTLRSAMEASGPIVTKTYPLSYATAKDVLEIIKNKKSERGEIVIDTRTNTLIVSDVQEKLDLIDQIIQTLDAATPQVSIETRIIEATSTFVRNLGIQWGTKTVADPYYGNQTSLQFPSKIDVNGALIPEGLVTKGISGPLGGYAVNLPAAAFSSAVGISLANVLDTFRVDMALTALETEGSGKVVSSQRVTAQNNREAFITQGRQIPVQTTANFTVTTQYVNAGLELTATPQITAEGTIILNLEIKNNAADFGNLVNGIPPITTQSARTTVTIPDGGTTVIGGVFRVEDSVTQERVPFLHQIPILGSLFKNLAKNRSNRELLIFITPRIQK